MSFVLKVPIDNLGRLKNYLLEMQLVKELPITSEYELFRLKFKKDTIIAYTSGKIVANGNESKKLLAESIVEISPKEQGKIVIGSDEAGKGEWLGPLTVAAVALSERSSTQLMGEGIMDSKLLALSAIRRLSETIKSNCIAFRVVTVQPVRFNERLAEVKDEQKSLNDLLAWGHATAIKNVVERIGRETKARIVVDEFDKLKMQDRLRRAIGDLPKYQVSQYPRAEEEIAVAAASILARDEREYWIDRKSREMHFDLRKLSLPDALTRNDAYEFAKVSFLKVGSTKEESEYSTFLQNYLVLEYLLRDIGRRTNLIGENLSLTGAGIGILRSTQLFTDDTVDLLERVSRLRNDLVHGQRIPHDEFLSSNDSVEYLIDTVHKIRASIIQKKAVPDKKR